MSTKQLSDLKAKISSTPTSELPEFVEKVLMPEPLVKPRSFGLALKDSILERMENANEVERREAEFLIMNLCAKLSDNPRVMSLFTKNIGDATKIVTQILSLKLPIGGVDMFYLVPYKDTLQLQLGYFGMLEIAYRSGLSSVVSQCVYSNDEFNIELGTKTKCFHRPKLLGDRGNPELYYACGRLNGDTMIEFMTISELKEHMIKHTKSSNVWQNHFDAMCRKTVIKKLLRLCPKTQQVSNAIKFDDGLESME